MFLGSIYETGHQIAEILSMQESVVLANVTTKRSVRVFFQVEDLCDIDSLHQRFGDGRFQLCRHGHERRGEIETTRRIFWTIFGLYGNGKSIHHHTRPHTIGKPEHFAKKL